MEQRVLILGDGLLGSEIRKQTGWDFISRKSGNLNIDVISDSIPNEYSVDGPSYNVIINCIANTNTYSKDKDAHWKTNYQFVDELIRYCNDWEIKLVHISTDYVYAGSVNNATEKDVPVHANNWYSYTKLLADGLVQLQSNDFLIARCSHKPRPFPYDGAWIDQIGNFDYVDKISDNIIDLIGYNASGVFNVGSETRTMYELATETKKVDKTFIPDHVPKNQSMNVNKMDKFIK